VDAAAVGVVEDGGASAPPDPSRVGGDDCHVRGWALIVVAHLDDAFGNDKVSGGWLVLGQAADEGTLYPPLHEDGYYGGTRWMPLPILTYALAHRLSGDSYWAAKIIVCLVGASLLVVLYSSARAVGAPRDVAAALTAAVVAVPVGFDAVTTIAGDALSTALQLGAVLATHRHRDRLTTRTALFVGALCALAVLAKLSALWAPAAIVLVLL
jgi:hypothetical protein